VSEGLPDLVQWSEGMLLTPQHFQQADVYWHEQLHFRLNTVVADAWGVSALKLDMSVLLEGKVRFLKLEGLMPDGTPFVFPGTFTNGLEIDVSPALPHEGDSVRVSLVVPARSSTSTRRDASLRRYDSVLGAIAIDENTGTGTVPVDRLRPRFSLWLGSKIPPQYVVCPLLEVTRNPVSRAIQLKSFQPPVLQWQAGEFLGSHGLYERLRDLNLELWAKLREMARHRTDDGPAWDEEFPGQRQRLDAARRLAASLPGFSLAISTPDTKPSRVYEHLASMVGVMCAFGLNPIPPVLDPYRHVDCEAQFNRAIEFIARKLNYIDSELEILEFDRNGINFSRKLPDELTGEYLIELRLQGKQRLDHNDRQALERWLKSTCIASEHLLDDAGRLRATAKPRLLRADEIATRMLSPMSAIFVLENESIELAGGKLEPLIQAGHRLVIAGLPFSNEQPPTQILLCRLHHGHSMNDQANSGAYRSVDHG
jgi:type VI secretion system protein ImpJ